MLRSFTGLVAFTSTIGVVTAGACGTAGSDAVGRDAHVYAAVIQTLASDALDELSPDDGQPEQVIFAGPLDTEAVIALEVQAAVVDKLQDFATIRFVDEWAEAIGDADRDEPFILEDGLVVLLGAVPPGASPSVNAERYMDVDEMAQFEVHTRESDGEWRVVGMEQTTP